MRGKLLLAAAFVAGVLGIHSILEAEQPGPSSRRSGWVISEIQYHPPNRADGKNLEFVELQNTEVFPEDLSGFRLEGELNLTFPANTVIPAQGYVVIAPQADAVAAAYGLSGVFAGSTNRLSNAGGTLRLRNPAGAVVVEVAYSDQSPWQAAADGGGPSLVLARPSFGERDPRAWAGSVAAGGSPGRAEPAPDRRWEGVVINEVLAHTDLPLRDYVELYHHGSGTVDLAGCILTDDPTTNRFRLPDSATLGPSGILAFDESQLGFALNAAGETLFLLSPDGSRVIDAITWGAQANGVAWGRSPDGSTHWAELQEQTPGQPNAAPRLPDIVINEVMYHPISDDDRDEYLELYNRGTQAVEVGGWKFVAGIDFTLPPGTEISAKGFLVVAADLTRLRADHPHLGPSNSVGDFSGSLANRGERVALARPEELVSTGSNGALQTNRVFVVVNEVTYGDGGRWGTWADGGGSSLELVDSHADNRLASHWADSDESSKSAWTPIESTGVLDRGVGSVDALQVILQGAGACLLDDVEVRGATIGNRVANGAFATGSGEWTARGTQEGSGWDAAAKAYRVEAVGRGDTGGNRIQTPLITGLNPGDTGTIRARARWLRGHPEVLLRLRGNYLEAVGRLDVPRHLGTPGAVNSRTRANAGPVIFEVAHSPLLPAANQAVVVTARVEDPDSVASVELRYRIDPATTLTTLAMNDDGLGADAIARDGIYTALLPGRPTGTLVAWQLVARDAATIPATGVYPDGAPAHEALVRWGDVKPAGALGTYRLWITRANFDKWSNRSRLDNAPLDLTFVYNDERVVHGVGGIYAGSPHISPGYNNPAGNLCGYVLNFPSDEPLLGATDVVLDWPGRDTTAVQEPFAYWLARELRLPFNHRRYVRLHVNGVTETTRGSIYEDAQQVNSDLMDSWQSEAPDGDLFKIEQWFEFNDELRLTQVGPPRLADYTTTGGAKKLAAYRWSWLKRAVQSSANDYGSLFTLVDALNAPAANVYSQQVNAFVDLDEWMRIFAVENIVCGFDSYGHDIGKNMYAYKPTGGRWQLYMWDIDWVMLASAQHGFSPQSPLMYRGSSPFGEGNRDPVIGRMYNFPEFQRAYWRALQDAVDGPLRPERVAARLDPIYAALRANGVSRSAGGTLTSPAEVKQWLTDRRAYLMEQLATVNAVFAITTPAANSSQSSNVVTLTGTAPVTVKELRVNGVVRPASWTTVTTWQMTLPLSPGANSLVVEGFDLRGSAVPDARAMITVQVTAPLEAPLDRLVINEIMYHAIVPGGEFVELHNRSTNTAFDLSGLVLEGTGLTLAPGTWIPPGGFLVVAADREAFAQAHGIGPVVTAEFPGELNQAGETLRLVQPAAAAIPESVLDAVRYQNGPPWPAGADGTGASLQLRDPAADNRRPAHWFVAAAVTNTPSQVLLPMTATWRYHQAPEDPGIAWRQPSFNDSVWPAGPALLYAEGDPLPGPKATPLTLGATTYYFRTRFNFTGDPAAIGLKISTILDDGAIVYLNGHELFRLGMPEGDATYSTLSARNVSNAAFEGPFPVSSEWLVAGENVLAVEVHQIATTSSDIVLGLSLETAPATVGVVATPGAPNARLGPLASVPPVWINELVADNRTGAVDATGERSPWVELYFDGEADLSSAGFALTDDLAVPGKWAFPTPGKLITGNRHPVIWLDGHPERNGEFEWHSSFRIPAANGRLALTYLRDGNWVVLDTVEYGALPPDQSIGYPSDGSGLDRTVFSDATPGGMNRAGQPRVLINEWMASNAQAVEDPADRQFKDWFELFNAEPLPVDLGGYTLTDDSGAPRKFVIPPGTILPARSFLLVWADEKSSLNQPGGDLHVNFKLSQDGELIALIAPDGGLVDQVSFTRQTTDVTQGRWPDGATGPFVTPARPSPRTANPPPAGTVVEIPVAAPVVAADGSVLILWTAVPGTRYRLESLSDLTGSTWQPIAGDIVATDTVASKTDQPPVAANARFYRVIAIQ